jgi:hypothetical protein
VPTIAGTGQVAVRRQLPAVAGATTGQSATYRSVAERRIL